MTGPGSEETARRVRVAASAASGAVLQAVATAATLTGPLAAAEPRLAEMAHRSLDDLHRLLAKAAELARRGRSTSTSTSGPSPTPACWPCACRRRWTPSTRSSR